MSDCKEDFSYFIYNDLRAAQNHNPVGNTVQEFTVLDDAIEEFKHLPPEWTTALGVQISKYSALDLVQRREGEPVLVADYRRISDYYGNPEIQSLVRQLQAALKIEWMSDFRVLGPHPILYPVPPDLDFVRDSYINGKTLSPDDSRHLISSVTEMYVQDKGWLPTEDVWKIAEKSGYHDPHTPKVSMLHVRYSDANGTVRSGDMHPYQYLLLQERYRLMEHDKPATKALAEAIEIYLYRRDPAEYIKLFGKQDRLSPVNPPDKKRIKDQTIEKIMEMIDHRDISRLLSAAISSMESGLTTSIEKAETRELLGRMLNIPENHEQKLPLDLRLRCNSVMQELYQADSSVNTIQRSKDISLSDKEK